MQLPLTTQSPVVHVDATPDAEYPLRILRAYRENCNMRWADSSNGGESLSLLFRQMNKAQEERAEILDAAIALLTQAGDSKETGEGGKNV